MSVCERLRVLGGLSEAGFAGFFGIFRMGEDLLTQVGSYERWTRVCERLRVLGGLGGAGFAGFFGIFGMAGVPPALVRWYEHWTRDCERLREIMSVCVCLVAFTSDWYGWSRMGRPRNGKNKLHPDGCGLLCAEYEGLLGWCSMVGPLMRPGEAGFPLNGLLSR